jgi:Predicted oxidoreductases (related to aryl-alcohol dehydrogenases)
LDHGVNLFDTCSAYGNSEHVLAEALRNVPSQAYFLATKVGYVRGTFHNAYHPRNIVRQIDTTLQSFRRDYVDILGFHNLYFGEHGEYMDGALETFHRLRDAGKIRWIAARVNHAPTFLESKRDASERFDSDELSMIRHIDPDVLQLKFNATMDICAHWVGRLRQHMKSHDLGAIVNKPLAQGLLLRKRYPSEGFPVGDHRRRKHEFSLTSRRHLGSSLHGILHGWSTPALVRAYLAYARSLSDSAVVLVGTRTRGQARTNFSVDGSELTSEELAMLKRVRTCFEDFEAYLASESAEGVAS